MVLSSRKQFMRVRCLGRNADPGGSLHRRVLSSPDESPAIISFRGGSVRSIRSAARLAAEDLIAPSFWLTKSRARPASLISCAIQINPAIMTRIPNVKMAIAIWFQPSSRDSSCFRSASVCSSVPEYIAFYYLRAPRV